MCIRDRYRVWLRWVALPEFARDECLSCQSQPSLFRAKESPLKNENKIKKKKILCALIHWVETYFLMTKSILRAIRSQAPASGGTILPHTWSFNYYTRLYCPRPARTGWLLNFSCGMWHIMISCSHEPRIWDHQVHLSWSLAPFEGNLVIRRKHAWYVPSLLHVLP